MTKIALIPMGDIANEKDCIEVNCVESMTILNVTWLLFNGSVNHS